MPEQNKIAKSAGAGATPSPGAGAASSIGLGPLAMLRAGLVLFIMLTVLTGLIYPLVITGIANLVFPWRAGGSLIDRRGQPAKDRGQAVGSALLGQYFSDAKYFWPRPSATSPVPYNSYDVSGDCGAGSNWGPTNPALLTAVRQRVRQLKTADPGVKGPVPIDLVTASASGLDPDISPAAALYQADRVAQARRLPVAAVRRLVRRLSRSRFWGVFGSPRINVLELNLALDQLSRHSHH